MANDKISLEQMNAVRDKFKDSLGEHKDKNAMFKIGKDKKSQQTESVSNILVIENTVIERKYAIAINATAVNLDGTKVLDKDPYLEELQEQFCDFLAMIKSDVEGKKNA